MMEFLFLDLDDTILDFHKAEQLAVGNTFRQMGLEPDQDLLDLYSRVNKAHWELLERGELTREQVLWKRFAATYQQVGFQGDPHKTAQVYEGFLSQGHYFLPGALEALQELSGTYKLYLASNGTARVQAGRLASAGISPYFQEIFVSETMGHNKPSRAYFDLCFARIPGFDPSRAMMVGDSLTSDILGGKNAGIATCWINPRGEKPRGVQPDYEIPGIYALKALLEEL